MSFWRWCVWLFLIHQQAFMIHGNQLPIEDIKVYAGETDIDDHGSWVLNVTWRDDAFVEKADSERLLYDIEVFLTEQMKRVHYETIKVKPDPTTTYQWTWRSPFPLECTSHSVRLRRRGQDQGDIWSQLYTYEGKDLDDSSFSEVYPNGHAFLVGSNITFCCIVNEAMASSFDISVFKIRISNRTYITEPIHLQSLSGHQDLDCGVGGTTVFVGYPPDDQNLTCFTRDLSSVECHWYSGRDTLFAPEIKKTKYKLNGRDCQFGECVEVDINVMNWTLIATNPLGVKIISDAADPLHRVWLKAPKDVRSPAVYERNVTIQWDWDIEQYASFSMICQVELNGHTYNKTFIGTSLDSVVLVDLEPFVEYKAKVRCGSSEHFYMWGDWSGMVHFTTKEEIPEVLDVWMQYLEQNRYVLWKPLTKEQSHGVLTGYELTMIDSNKTQTINTEQMCYSINSGNASQDQKISISAKNSAGLSSPATITILRDPENEVGVRRITSDNNSGFEIFWEESSSSSCGYVVDWFPTYSKKECIVKWKRIPSGHLSTRINSESFEAGVRYTISVYSCTSGAPQLLQRMEGYAEEQPPSEPVQNLKGKLDGRNLMLCWNEVPLDKQGGFILGYKIRVYSNTNEIPTLIKTNKTTVHLPMDPGSYHISIVPFTSKGEGVSATYSTTVEKSNFEMIVATVVGSGIAAIAFIVIALLCYRKKKWIKKKLYPDIPEPKLSGPWATKVMHCSQITEGYLKCEIQEIHGIDHPSTSLEDLDDCSLISPYSTLSPSNYLYQNISNLPVVSSIPPVTSSVAPVDPLLLLVNARKLTSFIENPTYIITCPQSEDISQISGPTLEMDDAYLPAPNFVQNCLGTDSNYKPHSLFNM